MGVLLRGLETSINNARIALGTNDNFENLFIIVAQVQ